MPPRWPRQPTREDPAFRRLDDRMNFAVHVSLYIAVNSGIWFFYQIRSASWEWARWVTAIWATLLIVHMIYLFAIADYSGKSNG